MSLDIIYLENITVSFSGFKALNDVTFFMDKGELRFVIGPNGAGKTTLLDIICRKTKQTSGRVFFDGDREISKETIPEVARLGISRKFQAPSVFSKLSVWQNMELAYPKNREVFSSLAHNLAPHEDEEIAEILQLIGLADRIDHQAATLSHGQKQWLEIGMTLLQKPQLLLVDEPVAGMTAAERIRTGEILTDIAKTCSVLVVEHDMNFVKTFSQKVTVLHEGRVLCEGDFNTVSNDPKVIEVYLGRGREHA